MTHEKLGKVTQASSARPDFSALVWNLILTAQLLAAPNMWVPLPAPVQMSCLAGRCHSS